MTSIGLKIKELFTLHCGCHGNLVTIAMRYVADAYHTKKASSTKYDFNSTQDKRVIHITLWLPW